MIECRIEAIDIDCKIFEQALCDPTEPPRIKNRLAAAVADVFLATVGKLVSLRVTTEIVVVVENENRRVGVFFLIEVRSR